MNLDTPLNKVSKYATAVTIGCRLNQTDTALIFDKLKNHGFEIVKNNTTEHLSLIIINTCSVTSSASQKSRQAARSYKKKHPDSIIILTGCGADIESDFWNKEPSVDLLVPNSSKNSIEEYLFKAGIIDHIKDTQTATPSSKNKNDNSFIENAVGYYPFKSRANIKIQEGCDSFCTYCIVPYGRGKPRSRDLNDTIREFRELVKRGYREIVLTGVNIATYNNSNINLVGLLKELVKIPGDFRIRLSSTEPQFNTKELIDVMSSSPKICRFLHLPLQHGTDEILNKMGRPYRLQDFADFVHDAHRRIPGICIGTDVIVGFPGETSTLFEECCEFIEKLPLSYLHVFRYSQRKGTPAAEYPNQIPHKISLNRHSILSKIGNNLSTQLLKEQIGKNVTVLFETLNKDMFLSGWSDNYIKVKVDYKNKLNADDLIHNFNKVKIIEISGNREVKGDLL